MNKCNKCYHNKVCLDSANYKNAEKCSQFKDKSLIVELPCKINDKVYLLKIDGLTKKAKPVHEIKELQVSKYIIDSRDCVIVGNTLSDRRTHHHIPLSCSEGWLFFNREEAEQALKERDSNA